MIHGKFLGKVALCGALLGGVSLFAGEGMWTFDNPPLTAAGKVRLHPDAAVAGSRPALQRAPERRRIRDRSSARTGCCSPTTTSRSANCRRTRRPSTTTSRRASTPRTPEAGDEVARSGSQRPGLHGERDGRVQDAVKQSAQRGAGIRPGASDAIAAIERESLEKTGLRSDVVTLYQGGEYWLYRYKKYTDVRIVFAPGAADRVLRRRSRQLHVSPLRPGFRAVPRV